MVIKFLTPVTTTRIGTLGVHEMNTLNIKFFEPKLEQCDILSLFWGSRLIKIRCKVDLYVLECHFFFLLWHTSGQKLIPFILYMVSESKKNKIYVKFQS